ncbi:MAG: DUF3800 domain-containing protein [Pseudomonadota bacterium]|nr:DUF3800 domain-containing protein [Pseudomonadota bacterium]MBU2234470.1 DUF3800 domain-containing protein [Pseudomonadota bacterium]MBU3931012.1 DUF3800 domain-containing protein [Pseudomonadota bacterium]
MTSAIFYVDESGDLGWKLDQPYNNGGSSRHLTIASLICPSNKKDFPKRLIVNLYKHFRWNPNVEMKWSRMDSKERLLFAERAADLLEKHPDLKLVSITVAKQNITEVMRRDENIIYNYMINLLLLDELTKYDRVTLVPDSKSIKVKSGNSLHDYLRIGLVFEKRAKTILETQPCDSACNRSIQFTDMVAGLIQNHYEDAKNDCWKILYPYIGIKRLFFPN